MKATFSEVRDMAASSGGALVPLELANLKGVIGSPRYDRRLNTMVFAIFSNVSADIELSVPFDRSTLVGPLEIPAFRPDIDDPLARVAACAVLAFAFPNQGANLPAVLAGENDIRTAETFDGSHNFSVSPCPIMPAATLDSTAFNVPLASVASGAAASLCLFTAPEVPGYVFKGWYTTPSTVTLTPPAIDGLSPSVDPSVSRDGKFHLVNYGALAPSIPTAPEDYTELVWSGRQIYGASHLFTDMLTLGCVKLLRYFGNVWPRGLGGASQIEADLRKATASYMLHSEDDGKTIDTSKMNAVEIPLLASLDGSKTIPRIHGSTVGSGSTTSIEDIPLKDVTPVAGEGVRYAVNLLMAKYAKSITVTFTLDALGGVFTATGSTVFTRALELSAHQSNPSVAIGEIPAVTLASPDLYIAGWFTGDPSAVSAYDDPAVRQISADSLVTGDTVVRASFGRNFSVDVKGGVWGRIYSRTGYATRLTVGTPFTLYAAEGAPADLKLIMYGDEEYFKRFMAGPSSMYWGDAINRGLTGYYTAHRRSDNARFSGGNHVELPFSFSGAPDVVYDVVCHLPVHIAPDILRIHYRIDSGDVQTINGFVGYDYVGWIFDVPLGSTVRVWAEPRDSQTIPACYDEAHAQVFIADGSSSIVWFYFSMRVATVPVYEQAFDSLFLFSNFLDTASVDSSKGALRKVTASVASSSIAITGPYDFAFWLFAKSAAGGIETDYGPLNPPLWPIVGGERYALAIDVLCNAWDAEGSSDPYYIPDAVSGDNNTAHCGCRVVFFDSTGSIIMDGGDEVTCVMARSSASTNSGGLMRFTAPAAAVALQIIFQVDAGYKAEFYGVQLIEEDRYDYAIVSGEGFRDGVSASKTLRRWVTLADYGPRMGSRWPLPSAAWSGKLFKGWATVAGVAVTDSTAMPSASLALRSVWSNVPVPIVLNVMGGAFSADPASMCQIRTNGDAFGELPVPDGPDAAEFLGWYTAETGGVRVTPETIVDASGASITLYARWSSDVSGVSHNLRFNAAGGSVAETLREVAEGSAYGPLPVPAKPRCKFLGWFTQLNGGAPVTSADTMGRCDAIVFAHWSDEAAGVGSSPTAVIRSGETPIPFVRWRLV